MGHKSSLNFSLTPGNALEVLHGLPGGERERAAQSRDLGLWRATGTWVEVSLLCLLLPIYRCIGLIEKRKHEVQRGDSSLPLGVKQRWTSPYFYLVYRRKNPINITSLCNALAGMETHLLYTAESSETKAVLLFTFQCQARCTARTFAFIAVSRRNTYIQNKTGTYEYFS